MMVALAAAAPARAQPARWEASLAYDYTRDWTNDVDYAVGWTAGAALPLARWLTAAVEAGGSVDTIALSGSEAHLSLYTFLGGVRPSRTTKRFTEFVQLLGGVAHAKGTAFGVSSASTHAALQPGGGVDYALTPRLSVRFALDFRLIVGGEQVDDEHHVRVLTGFVYTRR